MGVLIKNADITIYHLDTKTQEYSRLNIDDVNWNSKRNSTVSDKGVNIAYTTMIVAPIGDYKVANGDKVVKGSINLDITRLTDLKAYEVLTVVGIQENNILNTINIECK
ncbi:DUF6751 family protein [Clostridium neonatale]|uniref:DUF6751 family protein n=1 Tax=Clostridium neonatale TaxID=137838 RepID=UPI00293721D5|nr:DUF6751 family protein [Clostridium neonatale]